MVMAAGHDLAYEPVTQDRLTNPESSNWLQYRGNYAGWGYSPLDQITHRNAKKLTVAWSFSTGLQEGHQAPPIVNGGYMFVTTPASQVIALDAKTGEEIWRFKKELPADLLQLHPTNRGVALWGDKVYYTTLDTFLVALDAKTGEKVWESKIGEWKHGYYTTVAPLAVKGKIIVGISGGEMGIRGFVKAFNAETGAEEWVSYTTADDNSWTADGYKTGGGGTWVTGTYDPETNLTFWGTGNPGPWPISDPRRGGDNLYTTSVIAIDVDNGDLKGYHQYHWNDAWDWDEVSPPLLIDTKVNGKNVKAAVHAGRNGYIWVLERTKDQINFLAAHKYVEQDVFTNIDAKTGRPSYDPAKTPGRVATTFCPSLWGGKDWLPEAYNPKTGLFYIPATNNLCSELPAPDKDITYTPGGLFIGYPIPDVLGSLRLGKNAGKSIGEVQAWNLNTGKQEWVHTYDGVNWGPLLTTGGNLVFAGGTADRKFRAFNAKNGKVVWEYSMPSGVTGVPTSYEIDGVQYVAVQAGWGVDAQRMQSGLDAATNTVTKVPQGGAVMVFKLSGK
ncbi:MAG: PQQ-dependent dehydrogenase, methanol/ethanol family [Burkholderiales bacterium]|nr:PQQ-dependent dehydrogenase, methanol/ethanol family [Burkholderiales bacterium]